MLDVKTDFQTEGETDDHNPDEAFLEPYEIHMMFEQTKRDLSKAVRRKVGDLTCEEHGQAPDITIIGRYSLTDEEMRISYNINTCCRRLLMRTTQRLNQRN